MLLFVTWLGKITALFEMAKKIFCGRGRIAIGGGRAGGS
jgi:hypothetical protein